MKSLKILGVTLVALVVSSSLFAAGCGMGNGFGRGAGCGQGQSHCGVGGCGPVLPEAVAATLSAAQKAKIEELQKSQAGKRLAQCEKVRGACAKLIPAEATGDKAWAEYRKNLDAFQKLRAECRTQAMADLDSLAKLLTPEQRSAWLAAMKNVPCRNGNQGAKPGCGQGPSGCPNR